MSKLETIYSNINLHIVTFDPLFILSIRDFPLAYLHAPFLLFSPLYSRQLCLFLFVYRREETSRTLVWSERKILWTNRRGFPIQRSCVTCVKKKGYASSAKGGSSTKRNNLPLQNPKKSSASVSQDQSYSTSSFLTSFPHRKDRKSALLSPF